jgi:hypothetical protein
MMTYAPSSVTYGKGFAVALPMAEKVKALEVELLKMPQADIVTTHTFLPGVYERAITIPAWTVLTGAEHKTAYRVRLEKGTIAVNTDAGVKVLTAPCEFEASAGMQRAGRVYDEEVIWVDVYDNPDNCTDLAILEDRLYVVPECGLADSRTESQKARIDYNLFLHQLNTTDAEILKIAQNESDLIDMPDGVFVKLKPSSIHGTGLFATKDFEVGEVVCPGRLNGKRTPGGRFINHSQNSNIQPELVGNDIFAVAARKISAGDELLVDYRASMRVNFGFVMQGEIL